MSEERCGLLCIDFARAEHVRKGLLSVQHAEQLAERAHALADATRLTIATALAEVDELCVCDLAWIMGRSDNLVSHHLGRLRGAGLVASRRDGKMVMYSLTSEGQDLLTAVLSQQISRASAR